MAWYTVYCKREIASVLHSWRFPAMAPVQQSLLDRLELRKESAEQFARKQRVAASIRRIKQLYAPLRPISLHRV